MDQLVKLEHLEFEDVTSRIVQYANMSEVTVYGQMCLEQECISQLPLFTSNYDGITNNNQWWLRD